MFQENVVDSALKNEANELSETGQASELYELLKPFIEIKDPFALNLFSTFSLQEFDESEEEFANRSINLKKQASFGGIADASYRMGVNYLYGDDVSQSYQKAREYFELAITQGHTHTKFTFGYSLYYGTDENPIDKTRGLSLLQEASKEGSEGASNELARIKTES